MIEKLRAVNEINERIASLKQAYRGLSEAIPDMVTDPILSDMRGQLEALYWMLGYSNRQALDMAQIATGGDVIDWGDFDTP